MSGYDYGYAAGGFPVYSSKPVSPVISYDVRSGTRTYVARIESHVQEVRRPAATGYSHTYAMKSEPSRENRPREVDQFVTQILDEVNGPPVSTIRSGSRPMWDHYSPPAKGDRWSDYEPDNKYGGSSPTKVKPRKDYASDYMYGGSPVKSDIPQGHGDAFDHWGGSLGHVYDPQPRGDYGVPNKQQDSSSRKPEISRDYNVPSNGSSIKPEILQHYGVPNSRWDNSPKDYQGHENPRERSSLPFGQAPIKSEDSKDYETPMNPQLKIEVPRDYQVPKNQWERSSHPKNDPSPYSQAETLKDYESPKSRWGNSHVNPQSPRDYGVANNRYLDRSSSPIHAQSPKKQYPTKPEITKDLGVTNNHGRNSPTEPRSPHGYGSPRNQWSRFSNPIVDEPPSNSNIGGVPNSPLGHSPKKTQTAGDYGVPNNQQTRPSNPVSNPDARPPNASAGGVPNKYGENSPTEPRSPHGYGSPGKQRSRLSNPSFDYPAPNSNHDGSVPSSPLGNSPKKTQTVIDYGDPNNQQPWPSSPVSDPRLPNVNVGGGPNNRWGKSSPLSTQSPRGHGSRDNPWGKSSSPVYDQSLGNATNEQHEQPKDFQSKDYGSSNWSKASSYQPNPSQTTTPLGKVTSDIGEALGQLKIAAAPSAEGGAGRPIYGAPLTDARPKHSVFSAEWPPRREPMASPMEIDSREAQRRYGGLNIPSKSYTDGDDSKRIITSKDALEKYKGSFVL